MSPHDDVNAALQVLGGIKEANENQFEVSQLKNRIFFGDCRDVLERIPEGSIDLGITDPPWGIDLGTFRKKFKDVKIANDEYKDYCDLMLDFPGLLYRALKPNGCAYVFCGGTTVRINKDGSIHWVPSDMLIRFFKAGFRPARILMWNKVSPGRMYKYRTKLEYVFYFVKKKTPTWNNDGEFKEDLIELEEEVIRYRKVAGANKVHTAEKPCRIYESFILDSSNEGEIVIDPFAGSAPVILACKNTKRNYLAIEKDEDAYGDIIRGRELQSTIFELDGTTTEKPEQIDILDIKEEDHDDDEEEDPIDEILGLD